MHRLASFMFCRGFTDPRQKSAGSNPATHLGTKVRPCDGPLEGGHWAEDDTFSVWAGSHDVTLQRSLLSETIVRGLKTRAFFGKGTLVGGLGTKVTLHHNLLAHTDRRNPRVTSGNVDFVNNVLYNYGGDCGSAHPHYAPAHINIVNNFYKPGISSTTGRGGRCYEIWGTNANNAGTYMADSGLFLQGNIHTLLRPDDTVDEWAMTWFRESPPYVPRKSVRYPFPSVTTTDALTAYTDVLSDVGANRQLTADGTLIERISPIGGRLLKDVEAGTGQLLITGPSEVGGYPVVDDGPAYADADGDGMADTWEARFGLDKTRAGDRNGDLDGDGF